MPDQNPFADLTPTYGGQGAPADSYNRDWLSNEENPFNDLIPNYGIQPVSASDDELKWGDYGKMIMSGGIQIGSGIGWLFNNFEWGESLQEGSAELSREIMEGLSPAAKAAMQVEFTKRDEGQLWSSKKWNKAKLIAAQSLIGTAAGMGAGAIFTRGLMAAGMSKTVLTAAGTSVQVPTRTAGAIGYGLGEAGVAAPASAAGVEEEIKGLKHEDLIENSPAYEATFLSLEGTQEDREWRAKEIVAKAAAGDAFFRNMITTFLLSAPLGAVVGGYTGKLPIMGATTRPRGVALGAAGEATQEFLQSGAEKMGENVAMRRVDPNRPLMEGVLEEAVGGAMAGGIMGGTVGGIPTPAAPQGPPLEDADSPLAALAEGDEIPIAETDIDPVTGKPVLRQDDDLDRVLDTVAGESSQLADRDELDDALEAAYVELGIATETSDAAATLAADEKAFGQRLIADELGIAQDEAGDEEALRNAVVDLERDVQESAERRAQLLPVEEIARDAQLQKQRDAAFAQAEAAQDKEAGRVEREQDRGFEELEAQQRDEAYERELAKGKAGGAGVPPGGGGAAAGTLLGEKLQAAIQEGEDVTFRAPEKPVAPKSPPRPRSAKSDRTLHSLFERMARDQGAPGREARLSADEFIAEGLDIAVLQDPEIRHRKRSPFRPQGKGGMTSEDLAEYLRDEGYINPETGTTEWSANDAAFAVLEEASGRKLYHPSATEAIMEQEAFEEAYGAYQQDLDEYEQYQAGKKKPKHGQRYATRKRAEKLFKLEQEQDGVIPEKLAAPREEVSPDIGVPGDLFSEEANKQIDLVDVAYTEEQTEDEAVKAARSEGAFEEEELGEIPGWEDIQTEASTSPENDLDAPSKAQKEAGNYKMAHINFMGMDITIENPKGSSRRGKKQTEHYGYIRLTESKDGDQLDVFINPNIQQDYSGRVWIIDQMEQDTGQFDEHKVMIGYKNQLAAVRAYKRNYDKGWKVGPVTEVSMRDFQDWTRLKDGNAPARLTRPASGDAFFGEQSRMSGRASKGKTQAPQQVGRDYRFSKKNKYSEPITATTITDTLDYEISQQLELVKQLKESLVERKAEGFATVTVERNVGIEERRLAKMEARQTKDFRASRKQRQLDLFEGGKGAINAPNQKYIATVLSIQKGQDKPTGKGPLPRGADVTGTRGLNELVGQLVETTEARKALDEQLGIEEAVTYTRENIEQDTQQLRDAMPGATIMILDSYKQAPTNLVMAIEQSNMKGIAGVTDKDTGDIYMFADQIKDAKDANKLILHETFHSGVRKAFGKDLDLMLEDLYQNVPDKFKAGLDDIVKRYKFDVKNSEDRIEAAEELLAHIAEHDPTNSILEKFVAKIRQLLRKMGVNMGEWTDAEIVTVIAEAHGAVGRGKDRIAGVTLEEEVEIEETGEVFIVEQNAEQLLHQLEQRKDICKKIQSCL